jgi:asparagine synthase (glutamine-hydrolysing)
MCGLAGVLGPVTEPLLRAMTRTMVHRGPDDEGLWLGQGIGLGVRRLSIIDVQGGHQPLTNEDGSLHVAFNGEIYNHQELRRRLAAKGHQFRTRCDTEVLVHLHEEYGDAAVHLLRGMFAYTLWDDRRRRLLLVRDRLGIKPLYYAEVGGTLLFASEIKALLQHPALDPPRLNDTALDLYLTLQYVPGPETLFRGIFKLPPAHMLVAHDGRVEPRRYWSLVMAEGHPDIKPAEARDELLALLADTVRRHLISDVPVGALLSGGIDSSTVVALMARATEQPVKTFTVGFDVPGTHNELAEARRVAAHCRTEHHELLVKPQTAELLPQLMWHLDEPLGDPAALPTYLLCRFARQTVPVVLTGEGSDELLGGYPRYAWWRVSQRVRSIVPRWIRHGLVLPLARALPLQDRYRRAVSNVFADGDDIQRHLRWVGSEARAPSPEPRGIGTYLRPRSQPDGDAVSRLMELDLHTWLVDDVLLKMDKMSMANSVEARVPFLDHVLAEFVAPLPSALKIHGLRTKVLLQRAAAPLLPRATVRRRKHAFQVPVDQWLRGPLRDFAADTLGAQSARERGWLDAPAVATLLAEHRAGRAARGRHIWNLLCLEVWARTFLDGARVARPR